MSYYSIFKWSNVISQKIQIIESYTKLLKLSQVDLSSTYGP